MDHQKKKKSLAIQSVNIQLILSVRGMVILPNSQISEVSYFRGSCRLSTTQQINGAFLNESIPSTAQKVMCTGIYSVYYLQLWLKISDMSKNGCLEGRGKHVFSNNSLEKCWVVKSSMWFVACKNTESLNRTYFSLCSSPSREHGPMYKG